MSLFVVTGLFAYAAPPALLEIEPEPEEERTIAALLSGGSNLEGASGIKLATAALSKAEEKSRTSGRPISHKFFLWLGDFQRFAKQWDDARHSYTRAFELATSAHGADSMETGWVVYSQAAWHHDQGDYRQGVPLYRRAAEIAERHLGPDDPEVASRIQELAYELIQTGDLREVEPLLRRAAAILEKSSSPEAAENLIYLHASLGLFFMQNGQHEKATEPLRLSYEGRKRTRPAGHSSIGASADNLACNFMDRGDYASAVPLFEESVAILEQAMGRDAARTALAQTHFAQLLLEMGDYRRALVLAEQAYATQKKTSGERSTYAGTSGSTVALVLAKLGEYDRAIPLMEQSRAIIDATFGPRSSYGVSARLNLAGLYIDQARWNEAAPLIADALQLAQSVLGSDHPKTNAARIKLARYFEHAKEWTAGREALAAAEESYRRVLGARSPFLAEVLRDRARLEIAAGDLPVARETALAALAIYDQVNGTAFPAQVETLQHLATAQLALGDRAAVATTAQRLETAQAELLSRILDYGSEAQRLRALGSGLGDPYRFFAALGDAAALARIALRTKGSVLDSLLRDDRRTREHGTTAASRYQRWQSLRAQYSAMLEQAPKGSTADALARRQQALGAMEGAIQKLEQEMTDAPAQLAPPSPAEICAQLRPRTVALEFLRYSRHTGGAGFTPAYGVLLYRVGDQPQWIPLADAAVLDPLVLRLRESLAVGAPTLTAQLRELATQLWAPVSPLLPADTSELLISPDGALNFVAFAILPTDDSRFLGEQLQLTYLGSVRDSLTATATAPADSVVAIFAAPQFSPTALAPTATDESTPRTAADRQALASLRLPELPGSAREAEQIARAARAKNLEPQIFLGASADEGAVFSLRHPRVVHFATHGFFIDAPTTPGTLSSNPMLRAGLALRGAQSTLTAWREGRTVSPADDGILTAAEATRLELHSTDLIALSACDSGLGELQSGEGVFGLRRGFALAGAHHVLMTLWPVSDEQTADFMHRFYTEYFTRGDPCAALHSAQASFLTEHREKDGIAATARTFGAFVISRSR